MPEAERDEHSAAYEKHKHYRRSGLALMTTVITLSTGTLVGVLKGEAGGHRVTAAALYGVIVLALLQQLCNYFGEVYEARGTSSWLLVGMQNKAAGNEKLPVEARASAAKVAKETVERSFDYHKYASRWYRAADYLCVAVVVAFIVIGGWRLGDMTQQAPTPSPR